MMKRTAFLSSLSPFGKLLLLLGIILLLGIVSSLGGLLAGTFLFSSSFDEIASFIQNPDSVRAVNFLKFYQLVNQIGLFIIPALLFSYLVSDSTFSYLSLNKTPKLISILISGLIVYTILPANGFIDELNQKMDLPGFMEGLETWMKNKEMQAKRLTEAFLKTNSINGLFINIVIVALVPAIGEELLFRGLLLKIFNQITRNIHLAVFISAVIFSAIHLQFYGFFPRLVLGMLLGYLFVFTGNLWVPVFVHFVNNASSTIIFYLHYNGYINVKLEEFGNSPNIVYIIGSLLISLWLVTIIYQKEGVNLRLKEKI